MSDGPGYEVDEAEATEQHDLEEERRRLAYQVSRSFRPSAPVDQRDLLAGRTEQIDTIFSVLYELGQHAVVYGERGVGKTSLAKVLSVAVSSPDFISVFVTCDGSDDFSSLWGKVFEEIKIERVQQGVGFEGAVRSSFESLRELTGGVYRPNDVRAVVSKLCAGQHLGIFIDEYDQILSEEARGLMADTIKMLSDQAVDATVILIGVADSVDQLIDEHASVERAVHQVLMPRLTAQELRLIITRALSRHNMKTEPEALRRIVNLSQGLPHYTHLLGQYAAVSAVMDDRTVVNDTDVLAAIEKALTKSQQSTQNQYLEAVSSSQQNLYPQVVLACALAKRDALGYFSPADVREPLRKVLGRKVEIPHFMRHLNSLSEDSRGPLLSVKGEPRRYRYRFIAPLMQPYVVMKGINDGLIDSERLP
jgi:hypothetical protein